MSFSVTHYHSKFVDGRCVGKNVTIEVEVSKGEDRYNVRLNGHKLGWVCRPMIKTLGFSTGSDTERLWTAYALNDPESFKGHIVAFARLRGEAIEDLVFRQRGLRIVSEAMDAAYDAQ